MLQTFRKFTTGWVAWAIIILIVFAMSFFGIEHYFQTRVPTYSAKLESPPAWWPDAPREGAAGRLLRSTLWEAHEIDQREFRQRFDRFRQQVRASAGEAYDAEQVESIETRRQVLDAMIDERVLELVARREGIAVTPEQVRRAILEVEGITRDGQFIGDEAYLIWLQSRGLTASSFESLVAGSLLIGAMPDTVQASGLVGDAELERLLMLQGETRDVRFLEVPAPAPAAPPTEDELVAWHAANGSRYAVPEQVVVSYIELDGAAIATPEPPAEELLRARYEAEQVRFGTAEERSAAHILVAVPADADAAAVEAARVEAAALAEQARAEGADFAALAAAHSDDPGSQALGGELGPITRGVFPPAFEAAVFALDRAGAVSDPVRTDEGWHVIRLSALTPGAVQPFEAVREQLLAEFQAAERERLFSEREGQLVDAILRDPNSLQAVATATGLEIRDGGRFTAAAGEGIAASPEVREVAFSRPQREDRVVSDPIEIGPNRVVVLQVTEHIPETVRPLAEVREQALADLQADRAARAARERGEALLARARAGEDLESLAAELGVVVQESRGLSRMAGFPDPAIAAEAFRQQPPAEGQPAEVGLAAMAGGRYALVSTTAVEPADLGDLTPAIRSQLRDQLAQLRAEAEREAFVRALRGQFEITVAEDRL